MRKYLKWGAALLFANLALVSCEDNDENLSEERIDKPVLTVENVTLSGMEGSEVTFTVTSDRPISQDIDLKLEVVNDESEATFRDFVAVGGDETTLDGGGFGEGQIGYMLTFPAFATSHTFTISLDRDLLIEGTENLELYLRSAGNGNGLVAEGSDRITVAVSDYVSNDIGIRLDWSGDSFDDFGSAVEGDFHDYDFDIYVFDAATFDEVSEYAGATGALPENVELLNDELADGEYYIIVDLFDSPATTPAVPVAIPVQLTVSKFGVWSETISLDYMTNHATSAPGGLAGGEMIAATIVKTGTTYTLLEGDGTGGTVLASGRMSQLSNLIGKGRVK
ncbi:MAG TPA: hypothetical protein VF676_06145 [Flavobacterium sp.]|jgi:hypothetical protein